MLGKIKRFEARLLLHLLRPPSCSPPSQWLVLELMCIIYVKTVQSVHEYVVFEVLTHLAETSAHFSDANHDLCLYVIST